jgi:hypothetical protein
VSRRYSRAEYEEAMELFRLGHGSFKVARLTGIPRGTLNYWSLIDEPPGRIQPPDYTDWRPQLEAEPAYCYLLGLYLGDGSLAHHGNASRLTLSLDKSYPKIIQRASLAIAELFPKINVCHHDRPGCIAVAASHAAWRHAFPQDGPGRKHHRLIELTDWQAKLCAQHPRSFIRGLIHSDGSRVVNRFSTRLPSGRVGHYAYVRYFFTNYSADIRRIFCDHCDLLGIRWTQSSFKNISVANRSSVAILDQFVGPKA